MKLPTSDRRPHFPPGRRHRQSSYDGFDGTRASRADPRGPSAALGICLGEQLLGRRSEETGGVDLLGLIDADVRQLNAPGLPLPHMGGTESFPRANPRRPNCFLRTSNLENGSILSTALQCLTAQPPLLPAHTESRLPPQLPAKTSWACSSTQSARAKRALVFLLISSEPPHDYSRH